MSSVINAKKFGETDQRSKDLYYAIGAILVKVKDNCAKLAVHHKTFASKGTVKNVANVEKLVIRLKRFCAIFDDDDKVESDGSDDEEEDGSSTESSHRSAWI